MTSSILKKSSITFGLYRPMAVYSLCYYGPSHIWSSKQGSSYRLVIQTPLHPNKEFIMAMMTTANFLNISDTPITQLIPSCRASSFIVLQFLFSSIYNVEWNYLHCFEKVFFDKMRNKSLLKHFSLLLKSSEWYLFFSFAVDSPENWKFSKNKIFPLKNSSLSFFSYEKF